jgi:hypothetical protein
MGHTVAGWTGTAIALIGFSLCGLGVVAVSALTILIGAATLATAALITWLLHLAGWGKPSGPRPADQWDWRVRDVTARRGHPDCFGCRIAGRRATTTAEPLTVAATAQPWTVGPAVDPTAALPPARTP